jgi:GT2 family glycosyltransferase
LPAVPPVRTDVTVTVINYNGRHLLEVVLPSIFGQTVRGFPVHVVDDHSTDDSLDYLRKSWPQVHVLPSERNLGITRTMSRAVASADTPYVALLNSDLELDERWLEEMLAALDARPEAAAADGKMLEYYRRTHLDGAGDVMARTGYPRRRGQGELDRGQYDTPGEVFSATGGAALYRRSAFDSVGLFDGDLYAYYEDADWGFRARLQGMTAWYQPTAVAYHMGSATTKREPGRFDHLIVRNQIIVTLKNFPGRMLMRRLPRILAFQAKWLAFDVRHRRGRSHLRGVWGAVQMLPSTLRKRRKVQRTRTVPLPELERAFD